jgi:hypothetical protein
MGTAHHQWMGRVDLPAMRAMRGRRVPPPDGIRINKK